MPKFEEGAKVKHVKTQRLYKIVMSPDSYLRIEKTLEPAYVYRSYESPHTRWVRPATEMEDGRFELEC